jgi:type I restriction enzyme R subunit
LALLNAEPAFARMRRDVEAIAGALAEKDAIPMALILDVLTDPFWQDVTTPILENVFPSPFLECLSAAVHHGSKTVA